MISADCTFQHVVSRCLELLRPYSPGTAIYALSCLCPKDFSVILELVRLNLSQTHHHKRLPENDIRLRPTSHGDLLSSLRAYTDTVPTEDYCHFWLELTRSWLLTCPLDSDYYQDDETSRDLYCQKLRNELVDRILNIS